MSGKPRWECAMCGMYSSRRYSVKRHVANLQNGLSYVISFIDYVAGTRQWVYFPNLIPSYLTVVDQLNEDIASSYILFLQLRKQHAIIKGPDWKHIHDTLGEYATYIGKQAEELSQRLTVLGGLPISDPSRFKDLAYIDFEGNDMLDLRRMLENDLHSVQKVIDAFRGRIKNASENNDYGTEYMLKGIIFEYEEMADRLEHYLAMESLERNITAS